MASILCSSGIVQLRTHSSTSSPTPKLKLGTRFVGSPTRITAFGSSIRIIGPNCGGKTRCWFRFGKNGVDAEGAGIYGSQSRDDFDRDDVEQYFNYMGMLAVEGTYDKMEALLSQKIHPVDILLLMAASEGDKPKIEELLRAGASYTVKDADGRTALDRANEEIREFILDFQSQKA